LGWFGCCEAAITCVTVELCSEFLQLRDGRRCGQMSAQSLCELPQPGSGV